MDPDVKSALSMITQGLEAVSTRLERLESTETAHGSTLEHLQTVNRRLLSTIERLDSEVQELRKKVGDAVLATAKVHSTPRKKAVSG
jgi:uncharacterized protein (UPF0335 family)